MRLIKKKLIPAIYKIILADLRPMKSYVKGLVVERNGHEFYSNRRQFSEMYCSLVLGSGFLIKYAILVIKKRE